MRTGTQHRRLVTALALTAAALLSAGAAVAEDASGTVEVQGTSFVVRLPEGRALAQEELVGAVLDVADEEGRPLTVRIDAVARDPRDPEGEVVLYRMTTPDGAGGWTDLCRPDPAGERWAFPLAGTWTDDGRHLPSRAAINVTCSSGAVGKCVRFGYKPWRRLADGTPLWDHHQACVRMLRADYCGDGRPRTRDGTAIDLYDRFGIQKDEPAPGMTFEAAWGADGAVCVRRTRVPAVLPTDELARVCPRLRGAIGEGCDEGRGGALLLNKSF